jgi:hypothetical protein
MTSEMHPQAIRKVLDDEVSKWQLVEDNTPNDSGQESPPRIQRRPSLSSLGEKHNDDRLSDDRPTVSQPPRQIAGALWSV